MLGLWVGNTTSGLRCNCIFKKSAMLFSKRSSILHSPLNKEAEAGTETPGYMQTVVLEVLSQSHQMHSLGQDYFAFVPLLLLLHSLVVLKEKDTRNSNSTFLCMSKYTE
jgi:hypothetical protein